MRAVEVFFAFHDPPGVSGIINGKSLWAVLGHVEAFGYTRDDTWFFIDPARVGTKLLITHHKDEVEDLMCGVFARSKKVYKTAARFQTWCPPLLPQTCVSQCAGLIGIRAYTPRGLERKLQKIQAEVIHAR